MILDAFELPMRYGPQDRITTTSPRFYWDGGCEDIDYMGRDVIFQEDVPIHKYKFIENHCGKMLERIVLTVEELNLSNFLTADRKPDATQLYPLWTKSYDPYTGAVQRVVLLNGAMQVLQLLEGGPVSFRSADSLFLNTLAGFARHRKDWSHYEAIRQVFRQNTPIYCNAVVPDDLSASERLTETKRRMRELDIDNYLVGFRNYDQRLQEVIPTQTVDDPLTHTALRRAIGSDELRRYCASNLYTRHLMATQAYDQPPFEFDLDVIYDFDADTYAARELINYINQLPYTDLSVTYTADSTYRVNYAFSRYVPQSVLQPLNHPEMFDRIRFFVSRIALSLTHLPEEISLVKSWQDEIYIILKEPRRTYKLYFDCVLYELGSLAIVNSDCTLPNLNLI